MDGEHQPDAKAPAPSNFIMALQEPKVIVLAVFAATGGLLQGYDKGLMSVGILYGSLDVTFLVQVFLVGAGFVRFVIAAAIEQRIIDAFGKKKPIIFADVMIVVGALLTGRPPSRIFLVIGRVFVELGFLLSVGAFRSYIEDAAMAKLLVGICTFFEIVGDLLSTCLNLAFKGEDTSRWIFRLSGIPALLQIVMLSNLRESSRSLEEQGKSLSEQNSRSAEAEIGENRALKEKFMVLCNNKKVRKAVITAVGLKVIEELVGIDTVMNYSDSVVQLSGFANDWATLIVSFVTFVLTVLGLAMSRHFRGRKYEQKLLLSSLCGVIVLLFSVSLVCRVATSDSPPVSGDTYQFWNMTCSGYVLDGAGGTNWDCMKCLKAPDDCGFCASPTNKLFPGTCLISEDDIGEDNCHSNRRAWYTLGCPHRYGWLALPALALYIILFSSGMRTASYILDFQLHPFWVGRACETIADAAGLASNLVVQVALSLTQPKAIATFWAFLTFGLISVAASAFIGYFARFDKYAGVKRFVTYALFVHSTMRLINYWRAKRRDEPKLLADTV